MTAQEILIDHLKKHGYDGLCHEDCGCGIDDFNPCQGSFGLCTPAYKWECVNAYCDSFDPYKGKCTCFRMCKQEG